MFAAANKRDYATVPSITSVAVPGVVVTVPSGPVTYVAAGTVITPGTDANSPVVSEYV